LRLPPRQGPKSCSSTTGRVRRPRCHRGGTSVAEISNEALARPEHTTTANEEARLRPTPAIPGSRSATSTHRRPIAHDFTPHPFSSHPPRRGGQPFRVTARAALGVAVRPHRSPRQVPRRPLFAQPHFRAANAPSYTAGIRSRPFNPTSQPTPCVFVANFG